MSNRVQLFAIGLLVVCLAGCATIGSKSKDGTDGEPEWIQNLKALKGTDTSTGVSREAREIEESLGAL